MAITLLSRVPAMAVLMGMPVLFGCAAGPDTTATLSPEEVVARMSGRSMATNDTVTFGVGYGLDGLAYALQPLTHKCRQQQGQPVTGRKRNVIFQDRRKELRPITLGLTETVACYQGATALWAANIELIDPEYLVAKSIGTGINYYAKVKTTFVPGAVVNANRERAEQERIAAEASSKTQAEARQAQLAQCRLRREEQSRAIQTRPTVGMRVALGLIVEVKPPLVLLQYDEHGQMLRGRQQEWVPASTLKAVDDCLP